MSSMRIERERRARDFLREYEGWVRKNFSAIADLPTTSALVSGPVDDFLDAMARFVERSASETEVQIAKDALSDAYREAKKAATSRRKKIRPIRKLRKIRTPRDPREED